MQSNYNFFCLVLFYIDKGQEARRRKMAAWSITIVCAGVLVLASAASAKNLPTYVVMISKSLFCYF